MFSISFKGLPGQFGWLGVTGQSGVGKETFVRLLKGELNLREIPYIHIANGDIIRTIIKEDGYIGKVIAAINNQGKKISKELMMSLWIQELRRQGYDGTQVIVHDGTPRWPDDYDVMMRLVEDGYLPRPLMIEVIARNDLCVSRIIKRTEVDKREDLSIDGQPGVPDENKIMTKLGWYDNDRQEIVDIWTSKGSYVPVLNEGTLEELERNVRKIF